MKPGKELDRLVAEKVMDYYKNFDNILSPPKYSTDIAAAWEVVEKLAEDTHGGFALNQLRFPHRQGIRGYLTSFYGETHVEATADTAPHAICLAALKAVGVEV